MLTRLLDRVARPLLLILDAEEAHRLGLNGLKLMPLPQPAPDDPKLAVAAFGLAFPNPVGLAAGFDKNAEVPDQALRLGFGFVEVGGVTPRPQIGNPRPRVFRLPADGAVINRLGFNNDGMEVLAARLAARAGRPGIVGLNLGSNKETVDRAADFERLVAAFAPLVSFLTVNVSSPNTPGLRDMQEARALDDLLARSVAARDRAAAAGRRCPLLLKIAPDLDLVALDAIVAVALRRGMDGIVVSNTTVSRPPALKDTAIAREAGGLSGKPLFAMSTKLLAETYLRVEGAVPLIGVGGVDSGEAAWAKITAGASLVQLYTGMIYKGFGLIPDIKATLLRLMRLSGVDTLSVIVGRDALDWAGRAIEL